MAFGASGENGPADEGRDSVDPVQKDPVEYVDPMIGTGNTSRWMLYPGPSMPFGMVKLSPDNQEEQWNGGYEYAIENISGFSHLHSWTMGGLMTVPTTGRLQVRPGPEEDPDLGYRSRISHQTEQAEPGYYAVTLEDHGVQAELTSTTRTGMQRYTFPEAEEARVLLDLEFPTEYGFEVLDAEIRRVSEREIEGYSVQRSTRYNEYTVHFVARFSKPFESMGGWNRGEIQKQIEQIAGSGDLGAYAAFGSTKKGETVTLKTGISLVSVEQARLNLEEETGDYGFDFEAVREHNRSTWNELLSRIEVEGGTPEQKTKFYTNLYRSYTARTVWSDVNGKYVDMCEEVQTLEDPSSPVLGADAFWNTFWNLNQLWTLVNPEIANDWVESFLEIYDQGGWLPKGPTGIEYSSIMVASHEIPLMVSAYQKGIRDYDVQRAYEAIRQVQTTSGRPHECGGRVGNEQLSSYREFGYVPVEDGPVSNTLEYAVDDWAAGQMAKGLGRTEDYEMFTERAQNYRNVVDTSIGYVRPRYADGDWALGWNRMAEDGWFVEGNSWQFTWFVPHDLEGLIELIGGNEAAVDRLDEGFERARPHKWATPAGQHEEVFVNHGNQPNMQAAYLFNYAGAPWLTQKWARAIMNEYYGSSPTDGWPGDEDQGQMGAWYVMSAMGLFEMRGGASTDPVYDIGSPIFDRVTIHLDGDYYEGETFVVEAQNNSPENVYVQSAELNGEELEGPWVRFAEVSGGGKLVLEMGPEPNREWGTNVDVPSDGE